MAEDKKNKKLKLRPRPKTLAEIRVARFIIEEMDRYIKLHKEHEKDLKYIG